MAEISTEEGMDKKENRSADQSYSTSESRVGNIKRKQQNRLKKKGQ
jgi:hypothetical protein